MKMIIIYSDLISIEIPRDNLHDESRNLKWMRVN